MIFFFFFFMAGVLHLKLSVLIRIALKLKTEVALQSRLRFFNSKSYMFIENGMTTYY